MTSLMKCAIVAGGELGDSDKIKTVLNSAQLIVCADGGASHLRRLNITPHVMLGDFDSIRPEDKLFFTNKKVPIHTFPARKDQTDSEICVHWAVENGAIDITLLGATGTRMDHTLANIFLLKSLAEKQISARIINTHNEIHTVVNRLEIQGKPGEFLSLIPATEIVLGVTLTGLEYPLENVSLKMGSTIGISNVFITDKATISIKKGVLIVIKSKD